MKSALVYLAEGFDDVEAVTVIDILRRAGMEVTVAGLGEGPARGARGVLVTPDTVLAPVKDNLYDAVILPGGGGGAERLAASATVKEMVLRHAREGKWIAAICAAPAVVLAPWGILDGKKATCFPGMENRFSPSTTFVAEPVVVDGRIVTSRALGTALAFSLTLVKNLCGAESAERVRRNILG